MSKSNPTVIVTGASQGIGAAIALEFASRGAKHIALVARNAELLKTVSDKCVQRGSEASTHVCDLTIHEQVEDTMASVLGSVGKPDVLVNNAGAFTPGSLLETSIEQFRSQIDVNLTSAFSVTRSILGEMQDNGSGHIFFIASVASIRGYPGGVAYCAAKHGMLGLARAVRAETLEKGIRITTVMPGATRTASWDGTDFPDARFIPPEDVAASVCDVYRLSDRTVVEEIVLRPQLGDI